MKDSDLLKQSKQVCFLKHRLKSKLLSLVELTFYIDSQVTDLSVLDTANVHIKRLIYQLDALVSPFINNNK